MIVRGCIAFRRGDTLLERVELAHRDLAVAVAEAAYRAGALGGRRRVRRQPRLRREDPARVEGRARHSARRGRRERMRALGNEDVAIVQVMGEYELDVLARPAARARRRGPKRLAAGAEMARIRREGRLRGTICAWPTDEWARARLPGARPAEGAAEARAGHPLVLPARARTIRPATRAGRSTSRRCAGARRG